jgi:phage anti-repressor protein/predicted DNA-binding transcriptional regulator
MNTKSIEKALLQLEISDLGIKTYILLCKTPGINITQISIELGTYRQKIYEALDALAQVGLIEKLGEKISLKSPVILKTLLKTKQYELNKATLDYEDTLPELLSNYFQEGKNPSIKIYDGTNKFRYLFNIILDELQAGGNILSYNEGDDLYESMDMDYYFNVWIPKRVGKNIFIKILANGDNSKYHQEKPNDKKMHRDSKILTNNRQDKGCYWIAGNKIILWDTATPKAILIENNLLADLMAKQFELIWDNIN